MFCPNCGKSCHNFKFCPECGFDLRSVNQPDEVAECVAESIFAPEKIRGTYGKNQEMQIEKDGLLFRENEMERLISYSDIRKVTINRASPQNEGFLSFELGDGSEHKVLFTVSENTSIYQVFLFLKSISCEKMNKQETITTASLDTLDVDNLSWYPGKKKDDRKAKIAELEKSGEVYCPKCLSTKITAQKKGFGFIRGALGASVGIDVGMIAGGIGSNKIICTCMKCGCQWKPGKK